MRYLRNDGDIKEHLPLKYNIGLKNKHKPTYNSWLMMKNRCDNSNSKDYKYYGGKGISYDPRWKYFIMFFEDMGEKPSNKTLDRIDSNGNYDKDNCRWATRKTQSRNRSYCKLTLRKARNIRKFHKQGISGKDLAKKYKVSEPLIFQILRGEAWKE